MLYQGRANLTRWLDADTAEVTIRVPVEACKMVVESTKPLRLAGINAPEKNTDAGKKALIYVNQLCPPGPVLVNILGFEKYGRWLGNIANYGSIDVSTSLLESGNAVKVAYGAEGTDGICPEIIKGERCGREFGHEGQHVWARGD